MRLWVYTEGASNKNYRGVAIRCEKRRQSPETNETSSPWPDRWRDFPAAVVRKPM